VVRFRFLPTNLHIRLVKKLAHVLDGVDISSRTVGEIFDCPEAEARMLVLEEWAELVEPPLTTDADPLENEPHNSSVLQNIHLHRYGKMDKFGQVIYLHSDQTR